MVGLHIVFSARAIVGTAYQLMGPFGHLKVAPSTMRTDSWCSTHCMPHR